MIKIAYLYYDLLNLYGEIGNIMAIEKSLKDLSIEYNIDKLTIDDDISFLDYDFVYIGSGTEENEMIVLNHLLKYKDDIKEYIKRNKVMLVTGNTVSLFANSLKDESHNILKDGLGIIDANGIVLQKRIVCESLLKSNKFENEIIGFQNRGYCLENIDENQKIFDVIKGVGINKESNIEGIKIDNFYATYLIGPLLVRNPEVLRYFVKLITNNNECENLKLDFAEKAYSRFKENYYKDI